MSYPINLTGRLSEAYQLLAATEEEEARVSAGDLRVGSVAAMNEHGEVAGHCHRLHHLRVKGITPSPPDFSSRVVFDRGYGNEDMIVAHISRSLRPNERILRSRDMPVLRVTSPGLLMTGRPDIVVATVDSAGGSVVPRWGIECKSVASDRVAAQVYITREPVLGHLAQAAAYSTMLGVPFVLMYRQYSYLPLTSYTVKDLSKADIERALAVEGSPLSASRHKDPKYRTYKFRPFEIVYDVRVGGQNRVIQYALEGSGEWADSVITMDDVERASDFVASMDETGDLGPRPLNMRANGEMLGYAECAYCPLSKACDTYDKSRKKLGSGSGATVEEIKGAHEEWLQSVREVASGNSTEK